MEQLVSRSESDWDLGSYWDECLGREWRGQVPRRIRAKRNSSKGGRRRTLAAFRLVTFLSCRETPASAFWSVILGPHKLSPWCCCKSLGRKFLFLVNEPRTVDHVILLWCMWRGEPDVVLSITESPFFLVLRGTQSPGVMVGRCSEVPLEDLLDLSQTDNVFYLVHIFIRPIWIHF